MMRMGIFGDETHTIISDGLGNVYEGQSKKGRIDGVGVAKFRDGSVYEGDWSDSRRWGYGSLKFADGDIYEG